MSPQGAALGAICDTLACTPSELNERGLTVGDALFIPAWYFRKMRIEAGSDGGWTGGGAKPKSMSKPVTRHISTKRSK